MLPTSLLAHMTVTRAMDSGSAEQLGLQAPRGPRRRPQSTGSQDTSAPSCRSSHSTVSSTAWCSTAEHRMRRRRRVLAEPGPVQALDGEVVRLGAAGGENDFRRMRPGGCGKDFPRVLDGAPGAAARTVERRRVAGPGQFAGQRSQRLGGEGRGGCMIQVDGHGPILPAASSLRLLPPACAKPPGRAWCRFER